MLMLILLLILFLPGVFLPVALKTFFTSEDLNEMGVYVEDPEPSASDQNKQSKISNDRPPRLVSSLSL